MSTYNCTYPSLQKLLDRFEILNNNLTDEYTYAPVFSTTSTTQPVSLTKRDFTDRSRSLPHSSQRKIPSLFDTPSLFESVEEAEISNRITRKFEQKRLDCRDFIRSCIKSVEQQATANVTYDEDDAFTKCMRDFTYKVESWVTRKLGNDFNNPQRRFRHKDEWVDAAYATEPFPVIEVEANDLMEFKLLTEDICAYLRNRIKTFTDQELETQIDNLKAKYTKIDNELSKFESTLNLSLDKINNYKQTLDTLLQVKNSIDNWASTHASLILNVKTIDKILTNCQTKDKDLEKLRSDTQSTLTKLEDSDKKFKDTQKTIDNLLTKCHATLNEAVGYSLAQEFKDRSELYAKRGLKWFIFLCVIVSAIAVWSLCHFDLSKGWLNLIGYELPCLILLWPAWIASRRVATYSSLKEDYDFKAASTTAYSRYKDEIGNQDPALQNRLVDSVLNRFDEHPLRYVSKDTPATPLGELVGIFGRPDLKKILDVLSKFSPEQLDSILNSLQRSVYPPHNQTLQSSQETTQFQSSAMYQERGIPSTSPSDTSNHSVDLTDSSIASISEEKSEPESK